MLIPLRNLRRFFSKFCKQPFYAVKIGYKRIKALFSYYFVKGQSPVPEAITLFLTQRCNLRCKMCGQWGESGVTKSKASADIKQEISLARMKAFIDQVAYFKPGITLFGGEPLLYPDCVELIKHIKKKKMHVLMITNAALIEGQADRIVDSGLDELNVSLDGPEQMHDEIRGLPGLFGKITRGLKQVQEYKKKKGLRFPLINLQCTITKYNYLELEKMIEVAKDIGANSLTFHNLIFLGNDLIEKQKAYDERLNCSSESWKGFVFAPEIDPDKLYEKISGIMAKTYPFSVDFYPNLSQKGLKEYYENPSYLPEEYPKRCMSPWICAYVFPDGEVKPCLNSTYSFGNINEDKFKDIWNSDKAVSFRKLLKKDSIFPACIRCTELYRY